MKKIKKTVIALGGISAVAGLSYGTCVLIDEVLFNRKMVPPPEISQKISGCDNSHLGEFLQNNLNWVEEYGYEKHSIISDRGKKLVGYLMRANTDSNTFVFGAHGYRSYGKKEFCGVARFYLEQGINVFFPDHVASGESEGTYCTFGHNETSDSMKWLTYMLDNFGKDIKIILHGVSMGASTVMMMSGKNELPPNVKAVVSDCGFSVATELFSYKLAKMVKLPSSNLIKAVNFVNKQRLGFDFNDLKPIESVKNAKVPIMFIHGDKDALVPCYMAQDLYDACRSENKELLIIEGADHAQSFMLGQELYENKLADFINKNI